MTFLIVLKAFSHNFIVLQIYNHINYRIAIIKCNLEPHYRVWRIAFIVSNTPPDKLTSSIAIYKQSNFPLLVIILIHMSVNQTIIYNSLAPCQWIITDVIVLGSRDTLSVDYRECYLLKLL